MTEETHEHKNFKSLIKNMFAPKQTETVRETIEDLIEEANSNGEDQFSEHEQLLLNNILSLKDKKCGHAMIPRANIAAFQKDGTVGDLAELMITRGHSRIPIYDESLDDVIGVIHVIDLIKSLLAGEKDTKVKDIPIRDVKFVSPSMRVLDLLSEMQINKIHMALVVDEYGGIDGLVTIEDLLEEIVGDIEDEYDFEDDPVISVQDNGMIVADARAELEELNDVADFNVCGDIDCEELEIDTLGGLVFHLAQRIPNRGEIIEGPQGIKFRILDVDPRRIKKVMIIRPVAAKDDKTSETDTAKS